MTVEVVLRDRGRFFATRHLGKEIREEIERCVDPFVRLDLAGVQAFTITFADELFANLVALGFRVNVVAANSECAETIRTVFDRRGIAAGWSVAVSDDPA